MGQSTHRNGYAKLKCDATAHAVIMLSPGPAMNRHGQKEPNQAHVISNGVRLCRSAPTADDVQGLAVRSAGSCRQVSAAINARRHGSMKRINAFVCAMVSAFAFSALTNTTQGQEANSDVGCEVRNEKPPSTFQFPDEDLKAFTSTFPTGTALLPQNAMRLQDLDHDGVCDIIIGVPGFSAVYKLTPDGWHKLDYALPPGTSLVDVMGHDAGLRFVDVDGDGYDDVIFSNNERYSLHLFRNDSRALRLKPGWSDEIVSGPRSNALTDPIPPIVGEGLNSTNTVWFKNGSMWIQNDDTTLLPEKLLQRTYQQLLASGNPLPLSPQDSLKTMRTRPGFTVELVASEPFIADPIAFDWSADGRLWVLEMGDYPLGADGKGSPGGRLRVLTDTTGSGRYDRAVTFLDKLSCPEGLHVWRSGAVVIAGRDLFYAQDTNGDGVADVRDVLFTGFIEGNQQHRCNGFTYGLDGWLYGANGESDGLITAVSAEALSSTERAGLSADPINIRGQDFRFDPDHRLFAAIDGRSQYGLYRDDFGNWFGNNNSTWLWHYFFPVSYLSRNPLLPLRATKRTLANYADFTRCFPISKTLSRFNDPFAACRVTSGNSPSPYRDDLFGKEFATSIFISEPVHNLVHREILQPDGVSFTSRRADDEATSEFLASIDSWFRPTMVKTGPDGALYIADMYRLVIEHPQWIPAEMQKRLDLRGGADKGRIYRVVPKGAKLRKIPNLAQMSADELAIALDSPNGWQRDTAQRLLLERGDTSVAGGLESLVKDAKDAKVRIQALWTLNGLNVLSEPVLVTALTDASDAVKEQAIKLSERFAHATAPASDSVQPDTSRPGAVMTVGAPILTAVLAGVASPSPRLRFQLAFTLGEWGDTRAADALLRLLGDDDENIRNAALSSASRHAKTLVALIEKRPSEDRVRDNLPMLNRLATHPPAASQPLKLTERAYSPSPEQRAERARMLARYADVPRLRGDAVHGAALFKLNCAYCHRAHGQGADVGPDLGMMMGKPAEQLIEAIIDPNVAVEGRFRSYSVTMKDGTVASGLIISETPTTITLRAPHIADQALLRSEVRELSTSGRSLMPEGFEQVLSPQDLADLISSLTSK